MNIYIHAAPVAARSNIVHSMHFCKAGSALKFKNIARFTTQSYHTF